MHEIFKRRVPAIRPSRLGLRYLNSLPPVFEAPRVPGQIHPCLRLTLGLGGLPQTMESPAEAAVLVWCGPVEQTKLRVSLRPPELPPGLALPPDAVLGTVLDLDCFQDESLDDLDVLEFLEKAHKIVDDAFFDNLITADYHRYLEGKS